MIRYTCTEYREEMILLSLRRRLEQEDLDQEERASILAQIEKLETQMALR
jgi:hypothetical protein